MWSETTFAQSQLAQFWQIRRHNAFAFPVDAVFRHDCTLSGVTCKYATVSSTQKKLGEMHLLLCLSWLLRSRVWQFWKEELTDYLSMMKSGNVTALPSVYRGRPTNTPLPSVYRDRPTNMPRTIIATPHADHLY